MLIEKDIHKIFDNRLLGDSYLNLNFDGSEIAIRFLDNSSKLALSTIVYNGGNYIPSSVRNCISHKTPVYQPNVKTFLTVDEKHFQINLNYLALNNDSLTYAQFKELIEDFGLIAEKWRHYLDENDKNDLIYVRTK